MKQQIAYRLVNELVPYARNSRTHSDEQIAQIMASIKEFGFTNPILTDGANGVIAGHGRLTAAQRLGINEVPTIELSHLTEAQKKAYIIADNKIALNSGWDEEMLKIELEELGRLDYDFGNLGLDFEIDIDDKKENKNEKSEEKKEQPEIEFQEELRESHNYIVLYFTTDYDWLQAQTVFDEFLKTKSALHSRAGFDAKGLGRVLNGADVLSKIFGA